MFAILNILTIKHLTMTAKNCLYFILHLWHIRICTNKNRTKWLFLW